MNYQLFLVPLVAALVAQIIKLIIDGLKGQFSWKDLNSYGGMPSSHAALVTSLAAIIGYTQGWTSAVFALALIVGIIVIRDAGGFRRALGRHAQELNQLIHTQPASESAKYKHLRERIGHTPLQLFFGILTGLVVTILHFIIF